MLNLFMSAMSSFRCSIFCLTWVNCWVRLSRYVLAMCLEVTTSVKERGSPNKKAG